MWRKEADQWDYERYTRFDGLSDTYMNEMYPDPFGNLIMWPYSGMGITTFDGCSFTNLFGDRHLDVKGVAADRDMNMWIASGQGMFMISRNGELRQCGEEMGLPASFEGERIALGMDRYPVALIKGMPSGPELLSAYDGTSWQSIPAPFSLSGGQYDSIRCIAVDFHDHVWFGSIYSGAFEFDGVQTRNYTPDNSGLLGYQVFKMRLDPIGRLWFCCPSPVAGQGGLCFYDGQNWGALPGFDYGDVCGVALMLDGTVGVALTQGLAVIDSSGPPKLLRTEGPGIGNILN